MLVLFDIDGTLISTERAGVQAMAEAAADLFGREFSVDAIDFAGNLDPVIFASLLESNGERATDAAIRSLRERYRGRLAERLADRGRRLELKPGVAEIVARLASTPGAAIGLLTGNFEETGKMKLAACGLDASVFAVNAFGDESDRHPPRRRDLPPVALRRYRARLGREVEPERVTIIGDTPADVDCARANGCRSLGVATGRFRRADLEAAGATLALDDLGAVESVIDWLLGSRA